MNRSIRPLAALGATALLAACTSTAQPASAPAATPVATDTPSMASMTAEPTAPAAAPSEEAAPTDPLLATPLTDVRSGETFTLAELAENDGPVLLEPMAIWCTSCKAQQQAVRDAHAGGAAFTSVSLDVQLDELPEDLAAYAEREGFDWRFAMADAALYRLLQERFGLGATNPPLTPLMVVERDGTVRALEFGVGIRSPQQLLDELGLG